MTSQRLGTEQASLPRRAQYTAFTSALTSFPGFSLGLSRWRCDLEARPGCSGAVLESTQNKEMISEPANESWRCILVLSCVFVFTRLNGRATDTGGKYNTYNTNQAMKYGVWSAPFGHRTANSVLRI